ncbi:neprilysin-like [Amblyomma americanum]
MSTRPSIDLDDSFFENVNIRNPVQINTVPRRSVLAVYVRVAFLGIVAIVVLLVILVPFTAAYNRAEQGMKICDTEDCLEHARLIARTINKTIEPCHDFSAFVCSGWSQMAFPDQAMGTVDSLRYSWYHNLRGILLKGSLAIPAGRKPLAMYEKCTEYFENSHSDSRLLRGFLRAYSLNWPDVPTTKLPVISEALELAYKWQAPFWLAVNVRVERSSGRRRIIVKPGYYLPLFRRHHNYVADAYVQYYKSYYAAFFPERDTNREVNVSAVDEIRAMEDSVVAELNSISRSQNKSPAIYSFGSIDSRATNAPAAYWIECFQRGLRLQPRLTPEDELVVSDVSLLNSLTTLVLRYGDRKLKGLLEWQVVQLYSPLADTRLLVALYGSRHRAEMSHASYCAHHVEGSFKVLVLALGVYSRWTTKEREDIDAGFDSLVSAAVNLVKGSTWMDDESKTQVADKLASVQKRMWPAQSVLAKEALENIYSNFSENETFLIRYKLKSLQPLVEMYFNEDFKEAANLLGNSFPLYFDYDYIFNHVEVATGAAGAPAYYSHGTGAMFYGGLGFLMAMQLVKFVDSVGLQWSANGTNVRSILTESTRRSYHERDGCLSDEGMKSVFPEIPALEIAYSALKASRLRGDRDHLPLSPDLTEDVVFFLTICYMTCADKNYPGPQAADCNKVVGNSEAFAEAYGCPKGSRMNRDKCSFFG